MRRASSFSGSRGLGLSYGAFDDDDYDDEIDIRRYRDYSPGMHRSRSLGRLDLDDYDMDDYYMGGRRRHPIRRLLHGDGHRGMPLDALVPYQTTLSALNYTHFPAQTPNLVFPTARSFNVYMGHLSGMKGPWMQLMDQIDGRRVVYASGSCMSPLGELSLADDVSGELVRLMRVESRRSRPCPDLRVLTLNRYGDPLMTTVVPSVVDRCRGGWGNRRRYGGMLGYGQQYSYPGLMGQYGGNYIQPWGAGMYGGYGQMQNYMGGQYSPYQMPLGMGMYNGMYNPYSSYGPLQGRRHFANAGDLDLDYLGGYGSSRKWDPFTGGMVVAEYHSPGSRYEYRRRRRLPMMRLVRSPDGIYEYLMDTMGRQLANITYTMGGMGASFATEGASYRVVVQAGVDVAMVAAAIASRIWIFAETGVSY